MIKITLFSFQKHKNFYIEEIEKEYMKRLSPFAQVQCVSEKKWSQDKGLPENICKNAYVVGLYVEGRQYSSPLLAKHLPSSLRSSLQSLSKSRKSEQPFMFWGTALRKLLAPMRSRSASKIRAPRRQ